MKNVLVADPMNPDAFEKLKALPDIQITLKTGMEEQELIQTIPEFHIAVIRGATKLTRNVIQSASNLELIIRAGIGLDNIDCVAAEEKGIRVNNTPAATTTSVAEVDSQRGALFEWVRESCTRHNSATPRPTLRQNPASVLGTQKSV